MAFSLDELVVVAGDGAVAELLLSDDGLSGGLLARRVAERWVAAAGLLLAAFGYWRLGDWTAAVQEAVYPLGLPVPDTDLAVAGLGLGLVIAPLSAVALRVVPGPSHGVAAAGVVVARMTGMLIGLAALTAFGLWRFGRLTAGLVPPLPFGLSDDQFNRRLADYTRAS